MKIPFFRKKDGHPDVAKRVYRRSSRGLLPHEPKRDGKKRRHGAIIKEPVTGRKLAVRILFWTLATAFLGVSVHTVVFSQKTRLELVRIKGLAAVPEETFRLVVRDELDGKYLGAFPRGNFFLFSESHLRETILRRFRRIRSVEFVRIFPNTLRIDVSERAAPLLWCSGGPCYLLDEGGLAFDGFDTGSRSDAPTRIIDESAQGVDLGSRLVSENEMRFFGSLEEAFASVSVPVRGEYSVKSRVASECAVTTQEGWRMFVSHDIPVEKTAAMLRTFLETIDIARRIDLDYVDLRIENKIFYRLKDQTVADGAADIEASGEAEGGEAAKKNDDKKSKKKKDRGSGDG
jgi:hypothetical protein